MGKEKTILIDDKFIESAKSGYDIIEPVWYSVSLYDGDEQYYNDLNIFSKEQSYVFAVKWYLAEVYNGGHYQFYDNSTGIVWEEALAGAKEIGLDEVYSIIKKSVDIMGGSPSKDRAERQETLDNIAQENEDLFDDEDKALYDIDDYFIEKKIMEYIKSNREKFYFNGTITI